MTYLATNRSRSGIWGNRISRLIIYIVGIVVVLIVISQLLVPHFLPAVWSSVARPFWRMEFSIASGSLQSPGALLAENEALKRQLAEDGVRLSTIQAIEAENEELKMLLGRDPLTSTSTASIKAKPAKRILAAVLVRPPAGPYDELVLDGGSDLGFAKGDKVYAPGDVLIGTVSDVLGATSKVVLFSSPGERYQVLIGSDKSPATAVGRGGGEYQAELPRDAKVAENDFVLAPSIGDMPFGIVNSVITDPARAFETVLFSPPVNVYELRWVLVDTLIHE